MTRRFRIPDANLLMRKTSLNQGGLFTCRDGRGRTEEGRSLVAASALCSRSRSAQKCTKQLGKFGRRCFGIFTGSLRDPYPSGTVRTSQMPLPGSCPAPRPCNILDHSKNFAFFDIDACDRSRRGAICVSRSVTEPMKQPKQLPAEGRIDMDVDSRKALPWMADAFRPDTV